jgi:hypothetical protein
MRCSRCRTEWCYACGEEYFALHQCPGRPAGSARRVPPPPPPSSPLAYMLDIRFLNPEVFYGAWAPTLFGEAGYRADVTDLVGRYGAVSALYTVGATVWGLVWAVLFFGCVVPWAVMCMVLFFFFCFLPTVVRDGIMWARGDLGAGRILGSYRRSLARLGRREWWGRVARNIWRRLLSLGVQWYPTFCLAAGVACAAVEDGDGWGAWLVDLGLLGLWWLRPVAQVVAARGLNRAVTGTLAGCHLVMTLGVVTAYRQRGARPLASPALRPLMVLLGLLGHLLGSAIRAAALLWYLMLIGAFIRLTVVYPLGISDGTQD